MSFKYLLAQLLLNPCSVGRTGRRASPSSKKVAFHRDTGHAMPYCQNAACAKQRARHWHRDCCPNGGKGGVPAHSFSNEGIENSVFTARFQRAIDNHDAEEFDALCVLAGGKPDIVSYISACSFCEGEGECLVTAAVDEFTVMAQEATEDRIHINIFTASAPPPP
ncbi:hypothetical protein CYMTET_21814 [Cymbomonas tetramitiformis]|uniref:Uncharacterized protein n=1 Tax=Cymbomonas tetramitiformis TaxID=36881 RepID=A0AAE0G1N2_9CHLO|nr:hypothetical protein CYMTET_21814 [Cymbomonas tetramitiformis]